MAEDIIIRAGFEGSAVQRGLDNLKRRADKFGDSLTAKFTGAFAGTVLLDRAIGMATRTFQKYGEIADRAERAGISGEDFQRLGYAAELSGTSIDSAAKALREIRKASAEAAEGNQKQIDSLRELGFSEAEIRGGNLKSIDVLLRLASVYKRAGSDAQRFAIASSLLSARTANEMIPFLGTSNEELGKQMGREVIDNATIAQFKALADATKQATQAMEMYSAKAIGLLMRTSAKVNLVFNPAYFGAFGGSMQALKGVLNDPNSTEKEKDQAKKDALEVFEHYAQDLRTALTGTTEGGVYFSPEVVEGVIDQKFAEFFPADMQRARQAGKVKPEEKLAESAEPAKLSQVVASSLAAIGGGGGVFSTDVMVSLTERTANASERTAAAVERLAFGDEEGEPIVTDQ